MINRISLYQPETDDEYDLSLMAEEELETFLLSLTDLTDIETRRFADWVASWGEKYSSIGGRDTACRESVYATAEKYLSLLELVNEVAITLTVERNPALSNAVENVKSYFNLPI